MCTYKVGGVEVGLQLELFVEANALTLGHLFRCHVDHKPHGGICVVLLVVTGEREDNRNIKTKFKRKELSTNTILVRFLDKGELV